MQKTAPHIWLSLWGGAALTGSAGEVAQLNADREAALPAECWTCSTSSTVWGR